MTKNDLPGSIRLWAAVVLIAVFIIGAAAGAAMWHLLMGGRSPMPPPMMGHLPVYDLDLSAEQQGKMDAIFEAHRPKLDAVLQDTFPKVRAINEEIESEFLSVLTDEQKKRFEEMKSRRPMGPPFGMHPGRRHDHLPGGPPSGAPFGLMPPDGKRHPDETVRRREMEVPPPGSETAPGSTPLTE